MNSLFKSSLIQEAPLIWMNKKYGKGVGDKIETIIIDTLPCTTLNFKEVVLDKVLADAKSKDLEFCSFISFEMYSDAAKPLSLLGKIVYTAKSAEADKEFNSAKWYY